MFDQADALMINKKQFPEAKAIYEEILKIEPENIDALNSLATCIKLSSAKGASIFDSLLPLY